MRNKYIQPNKGGQKFCTSCMTFQHPAGGFIQLLENGTRQRWTCAGCLERKQQRDTAQAAA